MKVVNYRSILSTSRKESGSMTSGMISTAVSLTVSSFSSTAVGGSPVTDTLTSECQIFGGRFEASS